MAKATVISLLPYPAVETKPGLVPNTFLIPAAKEGDIEVLEVPDCTYHVYLDETRGSLPVTEPGINIANSIVNDFIRANLVSSADAHPGLLAVDGLFDKATAKVKFKSEIDALRQVQNRWFQALVRLADDDWTRHHQYRSISDLQRLAAKALRIDREWLSAIPDNPAICVACQQTVKSSAIICPFCKCVLKPEEYKKLQFAT